MNAGFWLSRRISRWPLVIRRFSLLLLAGSLFLVLSACKPESASVTDNIVPVYEPVVTESPPPPPVVVTVAAPQGQQSFSLMNVESVAATATSEAMLATGAAASGPAEIATSTATSTSTPTAMPTFTPPSLPKTPPWEHYWLRRPVPEESAVWTNKTYPYGSTRGGTLRPHHGVEFDVPAGTEVLAAASGTVSVAGNDRTILLGETTDFYGNVVVIELDSRLDDRPVYTVYGHLSEVLVAVGQHVQAQDVIALSGATGVADGAHLHFEVRLGENEYGSTRNPLLWLYPFPDRGVVAGTVTWPNGVPAREVQVSLRRVDAPSAYASTTTYAAGDVNPDDNWKENFAIDDVAAGYYELTVANRDKKYSAELWVYPYRTSFVELRLEP